MSASCLVSLSEQPSEQSNVFSGNECDVCCVLGVRGGVWEAVKASLFSAHKIVVFGLAGYWCEKTACLGKCVRITDWRLF